MNKERMAVILVVSGVLLYFLPLLLQVAPIDKAQVTGALFAVAGLLLFYLPSGPTTKSKKK